MEHILYKNIILDYLQSNLFNSESDIIYDYKNRKIKGKKILEAIDIIAIDLLNKGIKKGDKIIFLVKPSIESVVYFFSLLRVGAITVLVDPEMGQENFISRIKFSEAEYLLQDGILEKIEKYSFVKPVLRFLNIWFPDRIPVEDKKRITIKNIDIILSENISFDFSEVVLDSSEDMVIIFTSGTIGNPKGVVHSYLSLFNALNTISTEISISKEDFLYASQFYFILIGLMVSARTYIPNKKKFNVSKFINISYKFNITSAFLLPFEGEIIYKYLKNKNKFIPKTFKTILFGSAPVTKGFLSRFSSICENYLKVYGVYGSTEILPISLIEMREKIQYKGEGDLLGKPVGRIKIKISSDKEILITGPQLFTRYLGDNKKAEYFYSGDLGEIDLDGNIILLGRKKDMIIRKGFNVYPALFESHIGKIPGVIECSIIGVYNNKIEDEKIILFVVSDIQEQVFKIKLMNLLKTGEYSIDSYAYPDEIVFIKKMPRFGRSNKIDKSELQIVARRILCIK